MKNKRVCVAVGKRAQGWWLIRTATRKLLIPCGEPWPKERP